MNPAEIYEEKEIRLFRKAELRTRTIPGSPEVCWPGLCTSYGWDGLAFGRVSQAALLKWQQTHLHLGPLRPQGPPRHRRHCCLLRGKRDYFPTRRLFFHQTLYFRDLPASTYDMSPSGWSFTAFGGGSYPISKFMVAWKITSAGIQPPAHHGVYQRRHEELNSPQQLVVSHSTRAHSWTGTTAFDRWPSLSGRSLLSQWTWNSPKQFSLSQKVIHSKYPMIGFSILFYLLSTSQIYFFTECDGACSNACVSVSINGD